MSDEGRKIFPMETALGVLTNQENADVLGLLSFAVKREVCDCCRPVVSPVVRGWLMGMQPEFATTSSTFEPGSKIWLQQCKDKFGDNISIPTLPESEIASLNAVLDSMQALAETAEAKTAEADEANAKVKALEPFKAKFEKLEKDKVAVDEKHKALTEEVAKLKKEVAAFAGKVAIDQNGLEESVKDMVAKAVKEALANLPLAAVGAAGAGAAAAGSDAATGFDTPAESTADAVPDTFGFGTSGSDGDGFGF